MNGSKYLLRRSGTLVAYGRAVELDFPLFLAMVLSLLFGCLYPAVWGSAGRELGWRRVAAVPPLLLTLLFVAFVAAEDDYRSDGRSRWEVYDAQATIVPAVGLAVAATVAGFASYRRPSLAPWAAAGCIVAAFLAWVARVQMSN